MLESCCSCRSMPSKNRRLAVRKLRHVVLLVVVEPSGVGHHTSGIVERSRAFRLVFLSTNESSTNPGGQHDHAQPRRPDPRLHRGDLGHRPVPLRRLLHRPSHDGEQGTRPLRGVLRRDRDRRGPVRAPPSPPPSTPSSIDTNNEQRDGHIRSADFFDVENHPQWTFRSTGVRADGDDFVLDGELTIKGVTRPVDRWRSRSTASGPTPAAAPAPASPPRPPSTATTSASTSRCRSTAAAWSSATRCRSASRSRPCCARREPCMTHGGPAHLP